MYRTVTKKLLSWSNVESTTPGNNDADGFCPWPTPEAGASSTACDLATREVVETARSVAGRHSKPVGTTCFSYNDLMKGGCVDRRTFSYVPDNGVYAAFKLAAKMNRGKRRRHYGLDRCGTKSTQDGDCDGAISQRGSCDDQLNPSTPGQDVQQLCNNSTNQTSCNDNDPIEQPVSVDLLSRRQFGCDKNDKDAKVSSERRTAMCSGDEVRSKQDNRLIKTWLYNFLPPIATTQLGHGNADRLQGTLEGAPCNGFPSPRSRTASGRNRRPIDERHLTAVSRIRLDDRDHETGAAGRRQRQPRSAATDAAVHSHGQTVDVDRRRRRRCSDSPSDYCPANSNDTRLPPHCDCSHRQEVYEDATALTSRFDDDNDGEDCGDDDNNDEEEEKGSLKSFNSRPNELQLEATQSRNQLQLSLTGHVADIQRRHRESCKS